jgi:hypothetical protein
MGIYGRVRRAACVAAALGGALAGPAAASAAIEATTPDAAGAKALVSAMADPRTQVGTPTFLTVPTRPLTGRPDQNAVGDDRFSVFPTRGQTRFAVLSTGHVDSLIPGGRSPGAKDTAAEDLGSTLPARGTVYDPTILQIPVTVPPTANCLTFDFAMYSGEFPEFVGRGFNDAFIAELDGTTWRVEAGGRSILAPQNFAFDGAGQPVSVNTAGFAQANAVGTGYASFGATRLLSASRRVTPGRHQLYLSIFDGGDARVDSAVLVNALRVGFVPDPDEDCRAGAQPVLFQMTMEPAAGSDYVSTPREVRATVTDDDGRPVAGRPVRFTVSGANPATGTATTDAQGVATYTAAGDAPGTDVVAGCYDADANGSCEATASSTLERVARPVLSVEGAGVDEGDDGTRDAEVAVALSAPATGPVTVRWATATGTAAAREDYDEAEGTLTIPAGETRATVAVPVHGDRTAEGDETIRLGLEDPTVAVLSPDAASADVTIRDDDAATLAITGAAVAEGDGGRTDAALRVTASAPSSRPVTVRWATGGGTATPGEDYVADGGTLTIPPMATSAAVPVAVLGDRAAEPDETVAVTLTDPAGATIEPGRGGAELTIRNDDRPAPGSPLGPSGPAPGGTLTAPAPRPFLRLGRTAGSGRGRTLAVAATVSGPGTVRAVATHIPPRRARPRAGGPLAPGPGRLVLLRLVRAKVGAAGKIGLVLRRTAAGRRARYSYRTITLRVVVVFTPEGGRPIRATTRARVRVAR